MSACQRRVGRRHGPPLAGVLASLLAFVASAATPVISPSAAPVVDFFILDPGNAWRETSALVEGRPYAFNAGRTTDDSLPRPEDNVNLTFHWDFGDGTALGPGKGGAPDFLLNITHTYVRWGIDYRFNLTVTDTAGEIGWLVRMMVVQANVSAHPDLSITGNLSITPPRPRQGSTVQFSLDIVNLPGRSNATSLNVALVVLTSGPDSNQTISEVRWLNPNGNPITALPPGAFATVQFTWIVPSTGNISLKIIVWDPDEPSAWMTGNQWFLSVDAGPSLARSPVGGAIAIASTTTGAVAGLLVALRRLGRRPSNR